MSRVWEQTYGMIACSTLFDAVRRCSTLFDVVGCFDVVPRNLSIPVCVCHFVATLPPGRRNALGTEHRYWWQSARRRPQDTRKMSMDSPRQSRNCTRLVSLTLLVPNDYIHRVFVVLLSSRKRTVFKRVLDIPVGVFSGSVIGCFRWPCHWVFNPTLRVS